MSCPHHIKMVVHANTWCGYSEIKYDQNDWQYKWWYVFKRISVLKITMGQFFSPYYLRQNIWAITEI